MDIELNGRVDEFSNDFEVQLSQIVMKIFWVGYLAGKQQLEDDYENSDQPLYMSVKQLQDKIIELQGQNAQSQQFKDNVPPPISDNLNKKEKTYQNITFNHKKINKQHDNIVKQLLDGLAKEMKNVKGDIVQQTKNRVIKP